MGTQWESSGVGYGTCTERVRNVYGVSTEHVRSKYGVELELVGEILVLCQDK